MKLLAEKTFVINLPERVDRRVRMESLLKREDVQFDFIEGVCVPYEMLTTAEIADIRWDPEKVQVGAKQYCEGQMGCKRAHLNCLRRAREQRLSSVLIVEDDMAFTTENWYSLYLEAVVQLPSNWLQLYCSVAPWRLSEPVSSHLVRIEGGNKTTAILYSANGIEAALHCGLSARMEFDNWLGFHLHPFGCSYLIQPQITQQISGFSDIRKIVRDAAP